MKRRDKEQYLSEYSRLKAAGKPFFPYAIAKDGGMALIVMIIIMAMSLILGAELGPKADPTSTAYVPRPEWYFFFAFELLRVIKPPELVLLATVGIPTICMVLLILLPFYDRGPERRPARRPIAMTSMVVTILIMTYLTLVGAFAGPPTRIDIVVSKNPIVNQSYEAGKQVVVQSGCLSCHQIGENGNSGPGPALTHIGGRLPKPAIERKLNNPTAPMPNYRGLDPQKKAALLTFLSALR